MVLVAFEMISEDMAEYLADMNIYDREIMVLDHKMQRLFSIMEGNDGNQKDLPIL